MRFSLLNAMVWRIVAELYRRYAGQHDLALLETHPGSSMRGQLRVLLDASGSAKHPTPQLVLNLGGPTGTYEVTGVSGTETVLRDFATTMLSGDPLELVDHICRELQLAVPHALPQSTPSTLAVRAIADLFARVSLAPGALRATCACVDTSVAGRYICDWAAGVGVNKSAAARKQIGVQHAIAAHLFAVHEAIYGDGPLETAAGRFVVFDLDLGMMHFMHGLELVTSEDLPTLYAKNGRRLAVAVDLALKHLGR